jgi:hypothetical protein
MGRYAGASFELQPISDPLKSAEHWEEIQHSSFIYLLEKSVESNP